MRSLLSPRQLSDAVGVSESTVKRWIDVGLIRAARTAGGHRRISVDEAVRFLRRSGRKAARPELLGLLSAAASELDDTADRLHHLLAEGLGSEACRLVLACWASGSGVAPICDLMRDALQRIDARWESGERGIYLEHHASSICMQALDRLGAVLDVPDGAPVALGAAIEGDPSLLPSLMAATVLGAEGFCTMNLGANTPAGPLLEAVEQVQPDLVWISASYLSDPERLRLEIAGLIGALCERDVPIAIGGRVVDHLDIEPSECVLVGRSMHDLVPFGRRAFDAARPAPSALAS